MNNLGNTYAKVGPRTRKSVSSKNVIEPAEVCEYHKRMSARCLHSHALTMCVSYHWTSKMSTSQYPVLKYMFVFRHFKNTHAFVKRKEKNQYSIDFG